MKLEYGLLIALIASVAIIGWTHLSAELGLTFQSLGLVTGGEPAEAAGAPAIEVVDPA